MREADSAKPFGLAYTTKYGEIKEQHAWANDKRYDATTVHHCIWLYENQTAITKWRDGWSDKERQTWVHPATVHRHYVKHYSVAKPKKDKPTLKEKIELLEEERDELKLDAITVNLPMKELAKRIVDRDRLDGAKIDELCAELKKLKSARAKATGEVA
jgi:hypothetical protein